MSDMSANTTNTANTTIGNKLMAYLRQVLRRLPLALASGAALCFTVAFFTPMDIYAGNKTEFLFSFGDVGGWLFGLALVGTLLLGVLIALLPGRVSAVAGALVLWLGVMGYMQGMFLNIGMQSLLGDGGASETPLWLYIVDTALWVVSGVAAVLLALHIRSWSWVRMTVGILLVVILGMQVVGSVSIIGVVNDGDREEDIAQSTYLSTAGLYEVAPGRNTIVFVLDRFDYDYYHSVTEKQSDFFAPLTGFTVFDDNVTLYSRIYPAVGSMITGLSHEDGEGNPFGEDADTWFARAYTTSPFLQDMKTNGYSIRLYTGPYYGYRSAEPLQEIADNVETAEGYRISNMRDLVVDVLGISCYRLLPQVFKGQIRVTTAMFNSLVQYVGDHPAYVLDDETTYRELKSQGLTVATEGADNAFLFIHLNGCHSPYTIGKDGEPRRGASVTDATMGSFQIIFRYISELKRLGLYEDATILITGDHPWARAYADEPSESRISPVLVKPSGSSDRPLRESHAQVSQELNMHAFLVSSSGLVTTHDYGVSYLDVPEGVDIPRRHVITLCKKGRYSVSEYVVTGNGHEFGNWRKAGGCEIGYLYR